MPKKTRTRFSCPTEFALEVLGGKWKTIILCYLKERPFRYGELRRLTPGLSEKMLSERLRELIDKGLVVKRPPDGQGGNRLYALTLKGQSLKAPLSALYEWGHRHAGAFGVQVAEPLVESKTPRLRTRLSGEG